MTLKRFHQGKAVFLVGLSDSGEMVRHRFAVDEVQAWKLAEEMLHLYPDTVQEVKMYQEFNSLARELREVKHETH